MRENQNITYVTRMRYKWQPTVGMRGATIKEAFNMLSKFTTQHTVREHAQRTQIFADNLTLKLGSASLFKRNIDSI